MNGSYKPGFMERYYLSWQPSPILYRHNFFNTNQRKIQLQKSGFSAKILLTMLSAVKKIADMLNVPTY